MILAIGPWVLSAMGLYCTYLVTKKVSYSWLASAVLQVMWIAYAIATAQWGFIPGPVIFIGIAVHGWWKWRKDELEEKASDNDPGV